jgi:RHS repeat-associated protein
LLGRLKSFQRGSLTSSGNNGASLDKLLGSTNSIASDNSISYSLDALGNQASVDSKNQLTATHVAYDHDGNMVEDGSENTFVYDAWNRLIGGSQLSHDYAYDALGRRVAFGMDNIEDRNDYYYSSDGHNIEDHYCNGLTAQYVWGLGGPNELVLRDSNLTTNTGGLNLGTSDSGLTQRLYAEQDVNENVTALVGPTGTVAEHFVYDPYGVVQVMNGSYSATATDTNEWVYLHQGGRIDPGTGLYHFGTRDYNPDLGRWMGTDTGYWDGMDLYQTEGSNPISYIDPSGMAMMSSTRGPLFGKPQWESGPHSVLLPPEPSSVPVRPGGVPSLTSGGTQGNFGDPCDGPVPRSTDMEDPTNKIPLADDGTSKFDYHDPNPFANLRPSDSQGFFDDLVDAFGQGAANATQGLQNLAIHAANNLISEALGQTFGPVARLISVRISSPQWSQGLYYDDGYNKLEANIAEAGWGLLFGATIGEATAPAAETPAATNPLFQPGPYAGESIPAQSAAQTFTPAERAAINDIGYDTGCHTCGTTDPGTVSGNFVPDHQPVSSLNTTNAPQQLYPQCLNCSRQQGLAAARALREAQP